MLHAHTQTLGEQGAAAGLLMCGVHVHLCACVQARCVCRSASTLHNTPRIHSIQHSTPHNPARNTHVLPTTLQSLRWHRRSQPTTTTYLLPNMLQIFEMTQKKRERCLQEVTLLAQLTHPYIIQMLDAFIDENVLIIIFEWAPAGGELLRNTCSCTYDPAYPVRIRAMRNHMLHTCAWSEFACL